MRRVILLFLCLSIPNAFGGGTPVYDFFNHVESIFNTIETKLIAFNTRVNNLMLIRKIRNQLIQIQEAKRRFNQLKKQYESLTGKYGYGKWLSGPALALTHNGRPETHDELIRALRSGRASGEFADDRNAFVDIYLPPDPNEGRVGKDSPYTHSEQAIIDSTAKLQVLGRRLYDNVKTQSESIDKITSDIDQTENLKQSVDLLNTNVAALHRTMVELYRVQTLMAQRAGALDTQVVNKNRRNQEFYQW